MVILFCNFFISPILFKSKLNLNDVFKFLENIDCVYVDYRDAKKNEKINFSQNTKTLLDSIAFISRFKLIAKEKNNKKLRVFWVEIKTWYSFFIEPKTRYIEETNVNHIREVENQYFDKIIYISNSCPACDFKIKDTDNVCSDCGLSLNSTPPASISP